MVANIRNYGKFITGSRRLLVTLAENAATLPDVSVERAVLEQELSAAEEAKSRQDGYRGHKQAATQDLQQALGRAQEAVIQLQNAAKFKLGPRNAQLVAFQVKPLRKHGPRKTAQLKAQEEALQKQEAELQKQENDLLKKEVELLKKDGPAAAS